MEKSFKLSNFTIKLLACVFMTIDHIGLLLSYYVPSVGVLATIFRIIGRLAYPLFFFLAIEGARKTSNILRYLIRLVIGVLVVGIALLVINYTMLSLSIFNIFTTLACVVSIYFLLMRTKKWQWKLLIIIPLLILIFTAIYDETDLIYFTNGTFEKVIVSFMPDYSFFTLILLVLFFIPYYFLNYRINKTFEVIEQEKGNYTDAEFDAYLAKREYYNIGNLKSSLSISIVLTCLICYLLTYVEVLNNQMYVLMTYGVLSIVFILLYNGKLGFSNTYVKYGFYLYYPVHMVVLFGIFYLTSLI